MAAAMEEVLPKDVAALIKSLIPMLASQAWIFMGKVVNPLQRKVTRDIEQARLAVDCAGALLEKVDSFLSSDERTQLRQLLADLRLNFVQSQAESNRRQEV